jgi:hypothetical protein
MLAVVANVDGFAASGLCRALCGQRYPVRDGRLTAPGRHGARSNRCGEVDRNRWIDHPIEGDPRQLVPSSHQVEPREYIDGRVRGIGGPRYESNHATGGHNLVVAY